MPRREKVKPPKTATAAFAQIRPLLESDWIEFPAEGAFNGNGAPGRLLEHLVGVSENNQDSPDLMDWELKFSGGNALITLFHKDPEPRGIMRNMVHEYGWDDDKGRISFRHTISGRSPRGFYVVNEADRVLVRHEFNDSVVPYWKHNTLYNAMGAKLRRLILVDGEVRKHPTRAVNYRSATAYWDINIRNFCEEIAQGKIHVDFDARTKEGRGSALRNHGTKFRIKRADIDSIYEHSKKITIG